MISTFEAKSSLSLRAAVAALEANTSRWRWFHFPQTLFAGRVWEGGFRVVRVVRGRDSFNPVLYGRFVEAEDGTKVRVLATLHPVVWAFGVLWSVVTVSGAVRYHELAGLAFALVPWMLAALFFPGALRTSREVLNRCLQLEAGR